ncbi:hypothetical protein V3C99_018660 [Haemonchus contortus]
MMDWTTAWDIPVNLAETMVLHLGNAYRIPYTLGDTTLLVSEDVKDLGFHVSSDLSFEHYINIVVQKAFRAACIKIK